MAILPSYDEEHAKQALYQLFLLASRSTEAGEGHKPELHPLSNHFVVDL